MAEEHVPYTWYTGKTDGERGRSQEYLITEDKHNRSYSLAGQYKTRTADYGMRITEFGISFLMI